MTSIRPASERYDVGRAVLLAMVAALGGFLFGFDTAVINGAVRAIRETFQIGPGLTGFVVASALLGCALGAWLAGKLADRIGRNKVMVLAAALCSAGDLEGSRRVADAALTLTERFGFMPLTWALACLLADIGSAAQPPRRIAEIRAESADTVRRRGGVWAER